MTSATEHATEQAPRAWGKPKADCPAWCQEHAREFPADMDGDRYDEHRAVVYTHRWPLYRRGVTARQISVHQSSVGDRTWSPTVRLTLWVGQPEECSQDIDGAQAGDLMSALAKAVLLLPGSAEQAPEMPACPVWCDSVSGGHEWDTNSGGQILQYRVAHSRRVGSADGRTLRVERMDYYQPGDAAVEIGVHEVILDGQGLAPATARQLGQLLVHAADIAEARVST